ncbi:hypothetical protein A343_0413 [Porphyromonas gingivalis JCVI SC001]|nr:hypothetical protein A343_0413 [Porphyromonas gingivalis JCVI SC001]
MGASVLSSPETAIESQRFIYESFPLSIFNWNRFYKLKMIHITSPLQKEKVIKKYLFGIVFAHL